MEASEREREREKRHPVTFLFMLTVVDKNAVMFYLCIKKVFFFFSLEVVVVPFALPLTLGLRALKLLRVA